MGKPASQFRNGPPETGLESFKLTAILTAFAEKEKEESGKRLFLSFFLVSIVFHVQVIRVEPR